MPLKVPDAIEVEVLTAMLTPALTLKLYSNNKTPADTDTAAAYTESAGGGYVSKPLVFGNWIFTAGNPSLALYNAVQTWIFTGPTTAPGTIYGYFVTRNSDGKLMWAQRFAAGVVPFPPIAGSKINVFPRITAQSQF